MKKGINNFIFSSTATVYGEPEEVAVKETHPLNSINPYGQSKTFVKKLLKDYFKT
jgi:UDP-glucose 4-epimerase